MLGWLWIELTALLPPEYRSRAFSPPVVLEPGVTYTFDPFTGAIPGLTPPGRYRGEAYLYDGDGNVVGYVEASIRINWG
ncbi:MAG: hypothetical protein ACE5OY_05590 [Candidatus Bathyarchaeia archaeon]